MTRRRLGLLLGLLLPLLGLAGGSAWLLGTQAGLDWALATAVARSQGFGQQHRCAQVHRNVRVELRGIEAAERIRRKARRIVDQQPHRRCPGSGLKDSNRAIPIREVCGNLDCTGGHFIIIMMAMGDDRPAFRDQGLGDPAANSLGGAGDDGGP